MVWGLGGIGGGKETFSYQSTAFWGRPVSLMFWTSSSTREGNTASNS